MNPMEAEKIRIQKEYAENHTRYHYLEKLEIELRGARSRLNSLFVSELLEIHEEDWEVETEYLEQRLESEREKRRGLKWAQLDSSHVINDLNRMIRDAGEIKDMIYEALQKNEADRAVELTVVFMDIICLARFKQVEPSILRDERRIEREKNNMNLTRAKMQKVGTRANVDESLVSEIKSAYKSAQAETPQISGRQIAKNLAAKFGVSETTIQKYKPGYEAPERPPVNLKPKKAVYDPNIS